MAIYVSYYKSLCYKVKVCPGIVIAVRMVVNAKQWYVPKFDTFSSSK